MMVKNIGHKKAIARKKNNLTRVKLAQILQIPFLTLKKWYHEDLFKNYNLQNFSFIDKVASRKYCKIS